MALCEEHAAQYDRWLDYRTKPRPVLAAVDNSVRGAIERRRANAEDTYALIRRQLAAIVRDCANHLEGPRP